MPRPVHFDISANKPEDLVRFYADVFGWQFSKWDGPQPYWLIQTGQNGAPGIDGGMSLRGDRQPATVNTIDVPSVDEYAAKITASGGAVTVPKMPIPGVGWLAYAKDPDGNEFGIMQPDESAA